jgi:hypothetical protein
VASANRLYLCTVLLLGSMTANPARATQTIDFDSLSPGVAVTDQFAAAGVLFEQAVAYGFTFPGSSGSITICGEPTVSGASCGPPDVILTFVDPTDPAAPATTDSVSVLFGDIALATDYLEAFDLGGTSLGVVNVPSSPSVQLIAFAQPGIHRVVLHSSNDVAFDDVMFNDVEVPEPFASVLVALGLLGSTLTHRGGRLDCTSPQPRNLAYDSLRP